SFLPFSLYSFCDHLDLHSFPTRRSSDLAGKPCKVLADDHFFAFNNTSHGEPVFYSCRFFIISIEQSASICHLGKKPTTISNRFEDRKSTRLNSSHLGISYAVFCLKKKKT